ncbi:IS5 family transposase [Aminirod propionatiphilus]|uniref:IS5 family transposase n=1 Tax=Aminirod propionatiphilus TaxID=3415223 RepID=A0ACD1DZV5_9BACT|nr:IS5 family transposase [Synergistota bacterium]
MCKFRHLLEAHDLGKRIFREVDAHLQSKGLRLAEGTIMDATIIAAPSSTKNKEKKRDPDMHQVKKGNQYYFGMKVHIGVDKDSKLVHSLATTAANVHDSRMVGDLLHGAEKGVWGDSAYIGKTETIQEKAPDAVDNTNKRGSRNRKLTDEEQSHNRMLSKTRAKVEHVFLIAKRVFGFTKVRYKGLKKNTSHVHVIFALSNLYMVRRLLLEMDRA